MESLYDQMYDFLKRMLQNYKYRSVFMKNNYELFNAYVKCLTMASHDEIREKILKDMKVGDQK